MSPTLCYSNVVVFYSDRPPMSYARVIAVYQGATQTLLDTRFGPVELENVLKVEIFPTQEPVRGVEIARANDQTTIELEALMMERRTHAAAEVSRVPASQGPVAGTAADGDRRE